MIRQYNLVYELDGVGFTISFDAENEYFADSYGRAYCTQRGAKFVSIEEIILH